jgi:hypothetical protein
VNVETLSSQQDQEEASTRVTVTEGKYHCVNFGIDWGEEKERFEPKFIM